MSISITGLSGSGLDTTALVEALMEAERIPFKSLETKKTNITTQQDVFRQLNTKLVLLQSSMGDLRLNGTFSLSKGESTNANVANVTTSQFAAAGTYSIDVKNLAEFETRKLATTYKADGNDFKNSDTKFVLNGKEIILNPKDGSGSSSKLKFDNNKDVLQNLASEINGKSAEYKAKAAVVDIDGKGTLQLVLTATEAKEDTTVDFKLVKNNVTIVSNELINTGKEALVVVNGVEVKRNSNSLENVLNGISITLKEPGKTELNVGKDTDAIAGKVEEFVKAYNDVLSFINTNMAKSSEEGVSNPLQGDSTLRQLKDDLYNMFTQGKSFSGSNGKLGFLEELGIKIGADSSAGGKVTGLIQLDLEKLKSELNSNPTKVQELLTSTTDVGYDKLRIEYTSTFSGLIPQRVTGFDSQLKTTDDRLEAMSRNLEMKEARLKAQFIAMETMLSSLNGTSSWLTSQFDSLNGLNK